jgi:two-component system sensor histidine kinase KdpD
MREIFGAEIAILLADASGKLRSESAAGPTVSDRELGVANWTLTHREAAGRFTNTLPQSAGFYLPLRAPGGVVGVLALFAPAHANPGFEERQMLEAFAAQLGLVIEQYRLQAEAERSQFEEKSRQLQKTLLDSVSHEFKTPLAVIATATDRLRARLVEPRSLLDEIGAAVARLERVVGNLLDITRIETGAVRPRLEWCDLHEIVDAAVARVGAELDGRIVESGLDEAACMLKVDAGLLEEILVNLLRNAAQNSPSGSVVRVLARTTTGGMAISVCDQGTGVDLGATEQVFEKFHRGANARPGGLGLGLSIVRGFAEALGGRAMAGPRADGEPGAEFTVMLPVATQPTSALEPGA